MAKQQHSIDGFVPRRPGTQSGGTARDPRHIGEVNRFYPIAPPQPEQPTPARRQDLGINRTDLDESLKGIDAPEESKKDRKRRKKGAPKSKVRRIIRWAVIVIIVALLGIGGWVLYKAMNAGGNVFKGNIFDVVREQPLKTDENGRSNIIVLGTSEDDPGHQASSLTDSIMILSIDQKNKNAYMISVPRDLEVKYGQACVSGYQGKVNVYYSCVGGGGNDVEANRAALMKTGELIGGVFGVDIQYGVNVNYTVMRELVSAVGGITVTIESRDPRGQMDSNFDWKCGVGDRKVSRAEVLRRCPPSGHFIDYPNGPVNLDAEHALYLAQARGDSFPTYGFEQSNFDREKNQQKIVKAIREKALSAGVLANFTKVTGVIDALGNNLRTTFETSEVRTLVKLAKEIKDQDIQSIVLNDEANPILNGNAQPAAGMYQFGPLQAFIKKKLTSNAVTREEANVVVLNGSGVVGAALAESETLTAKGFIVSGVDTAPAGDYGKATIYQIGDGKPATKAKLESIYGVKVKKTAPPVAVAEGTNFIVIIGQDSSSKN